MSDWTPHLVVTPILLPLLLSALMLLFDERQRKLKRALSIVAVLGLIVNALALLGVTVSSGWGGEFAPLVYLIGNWPAPFGIVLVADRLAAMLLLLTSVLALASLIYATAGWDRQSPRYHALFLLMLMGVNGAFLTGDIFNLFVFFEVMLAASYGLALHGLGVARTKASLHYITINVATSLLFLIGVALIYSVTGTLNMADLANRIALVERSELMLLEAGAAILGTAFLVKAGMWPLSFWLPTSYSAAAPPVAAMFVILSKVGIYIIMRLSSLLFGENAGSAAHFADMWLLCGGIATIIFGTIGVLSCRTLKRLAGHYILISSGTLLAAVGTGSTMVLAGALFYLLSSSLAVSALYLLIEPMERGSTEPAATMSEPVFEDEYTGALEEDEEDEIGVVIPATIAVVGGGFAFCALLLAGLPPLSGFIAKFAIIDALLRSAAAFEGITWLLIASIIMSGLAVLIAMSRAGIDIIWAPDESQKPDISLVEAMPIGLLLALCLALMVQAGPVMRFMEDAAIALEGRSLYLDAVARSERVGQQ